MNRIYEVNDNSIDKIVHLILNGYDSKFIAKRFNVYEQDIDNIKENLNKWRIMVM